jgi:hypothetical protein
MFKTTNCQTKGMAAANLAGPINPDDCPVNATWQRHPQMFQKYA